MLSCARPSALAPRRPVDAICLRAPGRERDALHPFPRQRARLDASQLRCTLLDLDPTLGEVTQHLVRDTVDLEQPPPDRPPRTHGSRARTSCRSTARYTAPAADLCSYSGCASSAVYFLGASHVRDDDMGVQLRIPGARHPMPIGGRDKPLAPQPFRAGVAAARPASLPLEICDRRRDRALVRVPSAAETRSSAIACSTETLFGAENVRSNAATVEHVPITAARSRRADAGRASTT